MIGAGGWGEDGLPEMAVDDSGALTGHLLSELLLVIVHQVGIGDNDVGNLDLPAVGNGTGTCS